MEIHVTLFSLYYVYYLYHICNTNIIWSQILFVNTRWFLLILQSSHIVKNLTICEPEIFVLSTLWKDSVSLHMEFHVTLQVYTPASCLLTQDAQANLVFVIFFMPHQEKKLWKFLSSKYSCFERIHHYNCLHSTCTNSNCTCSLYSLSLNTCNIFTRSTGHKK